MTGTAWLVATLATVLVATLSLLAYGITGTPAPPPPRRVTSTFPGRWGTWRWPAALLAAVLAWALTGWSVTAPAAAGIVWAAPVLMTTAKREKHAIARAEAVGDWARRISDVLLLGTGLEQAVAGSARTAPAAITPEVQRLAARLQAHWPVEPALRAMADEIADSTADAVLAALILAGQRRGPGLAKALAGLAESTAEQVATRRRIEADRARPRTTARAVTFITVAVVVLALTNTDYLAPYATPLGQLLFAAVATGFAGCLWWMNALTRPAPRARALATRVPSPARQEAVP